MAATVGMVQGIGPERAVVRPCALGRISLGGLGCFDGPDRRGRDSCWARRGAGFRADLAQAPWSRAPLVSMGAGLVTVPVPGLLK